MNPGLWSRSTLEVGNAKIDDRPFAHAHFFTVSYTINHMVYCTLQG